MCNANAILFGARNLRGEEIHGKKVIELGSCNVNGSLRPFVESRDPAMYVGVDMVAGPGVDVICDVEKLLDAFGQGDFDIVVSTELLEHVRHYRTVISNIKKVCKPGGIILITTRSIGYEFHAFPHDFWRYEPEDMQVMFSDCEVEVLERDPSVGVNVKVRKPLDFAEKDLSEYELYSIVLGKRTLEVTDRDLRSWHFRRLILTRKAKTLFGAIVSSIYRLSVPLHRDKCA